jgi:hypothetical protein
MVCLAFCVLVAQPTRGDVLVRLSAKETIYAVTGARAGNLYFGAENGTFVIGGSTCRPIVFSDHNNDADSREPQTRVIAEIDDRIWLGTTRGLYVIEGDQAVPRFPESSTDVVSALEVGEDTALGGIWVGTFDGLYRIENGTPSSFPLPGSTRVWIRALKWYGGGLWVGTHSGLYRISSDKGPELTLPDVAVNDLIVADDRLWVMTETDDFLYGSGYVVERGEVAPVFSPKAMATLWVAEVDGEAWLATSRGLYRYNMGAPQCIEGLYGQVNRLLFTSDEIWLGAAPQVIYARRQHKLPFTTDVVELIDMKMLPDVPSWPLDRGITGMLAHAEYVWVWGETGLYRFERDVAINARRSRGSSLFFDALLKSQEVEIEVSYTPHGIWPVCPGGSAGTFEVVADADKKVFDDKVARHEFSTAPEVHMPYGFRSLYTRAKDSHYNLSATQVENVLVMDLWMLPVLVPLILLVVWLLFAPFIVLFAPWSARARSLLRHNWIREKFTLTNRIILKWQIVTRHLLRRHLAHHRASYAGDELARDLSLHFLWDLAQYRRLALVCGDISEVRRCLESIAGRVVRGERGIEDRILRIAIPIFLEISDTEQDYESIMAKASSRLATTTLLDECITRSLLDTAAFVFLIYDYRALTERRSRQAIEDFIQRSQGDHFVVLGSREKMGLPRSVRAIELNKIGKIWEISQRFNG